MGALGESRRKRHALRSFLSANSQSNRRDDILIPSFPHSRPTRVKYFLFGRSVGIGRSTSGSRFLDRIGNLPPKLQGTCRIRSGVTQDEVDPTKSRYDNL